jgi:hypothetical protein
MSTSGHDYAFKLTVRIDAGDDREALTRVMRLLDDLGFEEAGDGSLWLDWPERQPGALTVHVDSLRPIAADP